MFRSCFSFRVVNKIAVGMEAANAVCMAVIAGSSVWWDETDHEERATSSVVLIEMAVLCGEFLCVVCSGLNVRNRV